jgi:hypothetical protein
MEAAMGKSARSLELLLIAKEACDALYRHEISDVGSILTMRIECVYCIERGRCIDLAVLTFSATTPGFNRRGNQCTDTRQALGR